MYVVPPGPAVTFALLPVELGVSADGAAIVACGAIASTVFEPLALQPAALVTVTLYVALDAN